MQSNWFHQYLLPGLVFQAIIVAGGYGTGQELVQFFLTTGPIPGLFGLITAALIWSLVCMCCFEFARKFQCFEYRRFFQLLLGKHWVLFELSYLLVVCIVLSVIAASAGSMGQALLGFPYNAGLVLILVVISYLVFKGSKLIEQLFSIWSILMYIVFGALFIACISQFSPEIKQQLTNAAGLENFTCLFRGVEYASYNLGLIPAAFFALTHLKTRKQALIAGALTGPIAIIPGILFYFAMLSDYPTIMEATVPSTYLLQKLNYPLLTWSFSIILIGSLIETGVGLIHALNERIAAHVEFYDKEMPTYLRPIVAIICVLLSIALGQLGLVALISKGYGLLTWVILFIFILPLFTIGMKKVHTN